MLEKGSIVYGEVVEPDSDVTELGGPSGHETCRWMLRLRSGTLIACDMTAGHDHKGLHFDSALELTWNVCGELYTDEEDR